MKIGINLMLWTDDPTDQALWPLFERIRQIGFDGVELPIFSHDQKAWAKLGRHLDDLGLERTACTVCNAETDPISSDPAIRAAAVQELKATIDSCAAVGAELLCGPLYAAIGRFSGERPTEGEFARAADVVREVAGYADKRNIDLALEFLNRFEIYLVNHAAEAARLAAAIDQPNVGIHYDTFHAHIEEKDPAAAIAACRPWLRHVHIAENDRSTPGRGQVRWDETFDALQAADYDGWLTIEAFGGSLPKIAAATKIWRSMFADEMQLAEEGHRFIDREWKKRATTGDAK
ncbi:MAG: sugar phosphate isomerase/epimerase [Deltaproteobacteria bacterium]